MAGATSKSGMSPPPRSPKSNVIRSETIKRLLAFPSDTAIIWKSHDDSIAQRTAIDQARQEKHSGSGQHHGGKRRDTITEEAASERTKGSAA